MSLPAPAMRFEVELAPDPDSAAAARRALSDVSDQLTPRRFEDARLLVSELVTNAVRHAGLDADALIRLVVVCGATTLRIEVRDTGRGFEPRAPAPDPARASGWGLYLVSVLADRWGVERDGGTRVWFELDRDDDD